MKLVKCEYCETLVEVEDSFDEDDQWCLCDTCLKEMQTVLYSVNARGKKEDDAND